MEKDSAVLFLDDEENILNSINRLFINETYGVKTAINEQDALDIIGKEKIKVVVSDQRMPSTTGIEFLHKVKEINPDIIRILFTGYADVQAAEDAINKSGVFKFINKPWNGNDLKQFIDQAINRFDLTKQNKDLLQDLRRKNEDLEGLNAKQKIMYEEQKKFTNTVSHELRTPLAAMKMALDILLSETPGKLLEVQKDFVIKAKNNVDRLNRLINEVLDLSKFESKQMKLNYIQLNINEVVEEVVETQKIVAKNKGLGLTTQLDPEVPMVKADKDRIIQVLSNFINNALKFTKQGHISVSSYFGNEENCVKVSVEDTGDGISKDDMKRLFKKFEQIGKSILHKEGGTGLGLAISREIIEAHKGSVGVDSEINKGSCFSFTIPIGY